MLSQDEILETNMFQETNFTKVMIYFLIAGTWYVGGRLVNHATNRYNKSKKTHK